jgi:hypothetical protein
MPARSINPFAVYLRELQRYPVMDRGEEADLTRRARPDNPDLTDRQAARDRLVVANLGLVVHVAKRMARRHGPIPDRVEAGNIGLVSAAQCRTYDPARGRFTTYAANWIIQAICRLGVIDAHSVHVPFHVLSDARLLERGEPMSPGRADRAACAAAVVACMEVHPDATRRRHPSGLLAPEGCDGDLASLLVEARQLPGIAGRLVNLRLDGGPLDSNATARALGVSRGMVYWAELQVCEWATGVRDPKLHRPRKRALRAAKIGGE